MMARQHRRWLPLLGSCVAAACVSCGAAPDDSTPIGGVAGSGGTASIPALPLVNPLGRARCQPPPGTTGSPGTIEEAMALLNALPKPTSAACFVESLDRPLTAYATNSAFSAQPALSARSPRIFLKLNRLWVSIVIDGESSYLLEFSYLLADELRSIKGEVETPLEQPLPPSAPYDRVLFGSGTNCGLCHYDEEPVPSITFAKAFASIPFRPRPETRVNLVNLADGARICDWNLEPRRCDMLSALFDEGPIIEEAFPTEMPTFF
ncbi:MAG TPA: hypothetical protein VHP33_19185 [Polyangiaceae bacterium]|nr:hypothetical protein [Polyangiaceae bacterium]